MSQVVVYANYKSSGHRNGYSHPESQARIEGLLQACNDLGLEIRTASTNHNPRPELVHCEHYVQQLHSITHKLESASEELGYQLLAQTDEDTYISSHSLAAAMHGLALLEQAVDDVFGLSNISPFVLSRPPGHHALFDSSMGFCLFGNCAYAAKYAQHQHGIKKVAIVDWDVHHGNGTEDLLYDDLSVLTTSIHAYPFWPQGCGGPERRGQGANLNLPMPQEAGDVQYRHYFDTYLLPELSRFKPELLIVAAGFDAHSLERNSSLQSKSLMNVTEAGFSYMTEMLQVLANDTCSGRIIFSLEGGYYVPSLVEGFCSVVQSVAPQQTQSARRYSDGDRMEKDLFVRYCNEIEAQL